VESFLAELFAALGAEKVFRVPGLLQGRYTFLKTGGKEIKRKSSVGYFKSHF